MKYNNILLVMSIWCLSYGLIPDCLYGMLRRSGPAAQQMQIRRPIRPLNVEQRELIKKIEPQKIIDEAKKDYLEAQQVEAKKLKKEQLEAIEEQKKSLESRYPSLTLKGGKPVFEESVLKNWKERTEQKRHESTLKFTGSEGPNEIITMPGYIWKMSETFKNIISDLGGLPTLPIPIEKYSVKIIQDVSDIINPLREISIEKRIEDKKYSLNQLIERFNFVHFYAFPRNIQEIFEKEIIARTTSMDIAEIIKNKNVITQLDPNLTEFKALLKKANASYIAIVCKDQSIYVPEYICKKSSYLSDLLSVFESGSKSISLEYSASLLNDIFALIESSTEVIYKKIEKYSFDYLIEITNCLDFLGFSQKIQKPFHYKMYLLCKQMLEQELSEKIAKLNNPHEIFIDPVTQSLKNMIIKKTIKDNDSLTILPIPGPGHLTKAIFSPNNKMIASGTTNFAGGLGKHFLLWKINPDGSINVRQTPQCPENIHKPVECLAFSPDSKNIVVGCEGHENNLFVYKIDANGIMNKVPQILNGHSSLYVTSIAFNPTGTIMISASSGKNNNILLWKVNPDGSINENPLPLNTGGLHHINTAAFSSDGTMLVCGGKTSWDLSKNNIIANWHFNKNEILNVEPEIHQIPGMNYINDISFIPNSKKFIASGTSISHGKSPFLCDISNALQYKSILSDSYEYALSSVSSDGKMIIASNYNCPIVLFTIQDDNSIEFNCERNMSNANFLTFSNDSNKIMSCDKYNMWIKTLLSENQKTVLNDLQQLDAYQLLLIDKILDGVKEITIQKYGIPNNIIRLLKNLNLISIPLTPENT